jgi:putative spermidine/putrescine transport system permease protein
MIPSSALHALRRLFAVLFAAFMLLPLAVVLVASFTNESFVRFPPQSFGLRWYWEALSNKAFVDGFLFSIQVAAAVAIVSGVLGVTAALVVARTTFAGRDAIVNLLMMPLALPHIVLALALIQFFGTLALATSPYALVVGHVLITSPYVMRLTMTSLFGLDRQFERASASLGASDWTTFRLVTLPLIAPGVVAGVMFAFLLSFDEVTISLFTAMPGRTTLPAEVFNFASQGSDPVITAVSGLMIIVAGLFVVLVEASFGALRLIANENR